MPGHSQLIKGALALLTGLVLPERPEFFTTSAQSACSHDGVLLQGPSAGGFAAHARADCGLRLPNKGQANSSALSGQALTPDACSMTVPPASGGYRWHSEVGT